MFRNQNHKWLAVSQNHGDSQREEALLRIPVQTQCFSEPRGEAREGKSQPEPDISKD